MGKEMITEILEKCNSKKKYKGTLKIHDYNSW